MAEPFEEMPAVDPDGWTEWIRPLPGYLMQCCGCGLVHEMEAHVGRVLKPRDDGKFEWKVVDNGLVVMFRMRRTDEKREAA